MIFVTIYLEENVKFDFFAIFQLSKRKRFSTEFFLRYQFAYAALSST